VDDFERRKQEVLKPLFLEAGAGLLDCQGFEYCIALLLFHLSRPGVEGLDSLQVARILDNRDHRTAGQLIRMLKQRAGVSEGMEAALDDALAARNQLIHRCLIDNPDFLLEEDARAQLVADVRALRVRVQRGDTALRPFILLFNRALDGLDQDAIEREARDALLGAHA
jgi:hypothetical protein